MGGKRQKHRGDAARIDIRSPKSNNANRRGCNPREFVSTFIDPERVEQSRNGSNQVFFIELNREFDQQLTQFITERQLLVMVRLAFDVFDHCVFVMVRHGKRTVTLLPMREFREYGVVFDPRAGADFDIFDQVGEGNSWVQACQNVNMVFHAANAIEVTILVFSMPQV